MEGRFRLLRRCCMLTLVVCVCYSKTTMARNTQNRNSRSSGSPVFHLSLTSDVSQQQELVSLSYISSVLAYCCKMSKAVSTR